ncbi:solute carrier family 35 member G1 [Trichonephila clavata]|uniref:Solute carrier family 35 member G1 n=1 Tax=Trichonephila clavata TaxID=2740835 RepID=A0A8X6H0N6_TRICU|nr:solute carrier family 35 member G1 [Trichonephila clavata]
MHPPSVVAFLKSSKKKIVINEPKEKSATCENSFNCVKYLPFKGLALSMVSGVFYALVALLVKEMENISPGQLSVYRSSALFVFTLPQVIKCRENLLGEKGYRLQLLIAGVVGSFNLIFSFITFRHLPLGVGSVIIFSSPITVTVGAKVLLKEPCGIMQTVALVLTVLGIFLNSKVPNMWMDAEVIFSGTYLYGFLAGIGTLLCATGRYLLVRKLKHIHHSVVIFNYGCIAVVITALFTLVTDNFKAMYCGYQGVYVIAIGFFSYFGQILLTLAFQCENAGPVMTSRASSEIVLCFLFQILIFHDKPDVFSVSGAFLVGICIIFVGLQKWIDSLPKDSIHSKNFEWINK